MNKCKYSPDGQHDRSEVCVYCHNAELERLQTALQEIASQGRPVEYDEEQRDSADYETGYDMCILTAREALQEPDDGKIELTPYQEDKVIRQELEWLVNYEPTEDIEEWRKMADAARILLECYGYLPKQPSEARQGAENALQEAE